MANTIRYQCSNCGKTEQTRAKGAHKQKVTNYEKYFGTPEKVAESCIYECFGYHDNKPESWLQLPAQSVKVFSQKQNAIDHALEWLNQKAEE